MFKRLLSALLALIMLMGCAFAEMTPANQDALEKLEALGTKVYTHDDRVTFVEGDISGAPIRSMEDAEKIIASHIALMGGNERTQFEPWRTLTDTAGNRYYVFQQMYAETTVSGGAVKVVTDEDGSMLGLVASVETELPDAEEAEGITAGQAETLVRSTVLERQGTEPDLIEGSTEKIILPVNLELDPDSEEEKEESRFVWAVYSTNADSSIRKGSDLPYLAHYVTMAGEYLYSLPTIMPGDEVATAGYNAAYVFEFMEPVDYTGMVKLSDGTEKEITVTLMRDVRTGMFYLGNIERRIAVADCYELLYNKGHVVLESSRDNSDWDNTCLLSLYNYCRAWDYYNAIGWKGGDGLGTPMLILKDYCDRDHDPVDNAAYAGHYLGWQVFLSSSANDYSQCLDVLAHEFTHCVTGSVMTYNAYKNDYGAINEAMSDIQGNICEMMAGATEDTSWELGENSKTPVRNMSDPHKYGQPEFSWDLQYTPAVKVPTELNDRGGVHNNSSLLNNVAWRLCEKGGMSLEEARAFWFAVDCSMVPGTDYCQLSELLPWVMKHQGMEKYLNALEMALDATRMRSNEVPTHFDADRAMVTLTLPGDERFADGNWEMAILSIDTDGISQRIQDILGRKGEYAHALDDLMKMIGIDPSLLPTEEEIEANPDHAWDRFGEEILKIVESEETAAAMEAALSEEKADADQPKSDDDTILPGLVEWLTSNFEDLIFAGVGAAGQDGRTVRMVCRPGTTIPVLFRLEIDHDMKIKSAGLAAYTMGTWFDLATMAEPFLATLAEEGKETSGEDQETTDSAWIEDLIASLQNQKDAAESKPDMMTEMLSQLLQNSWVRDLLFFKIAPGEITAIPDTGLDKVSFLDEATLEGIFGDLDLQKLMKDDVA